MPNKTAFVTGGTGFIGLNLVEHLTQSGWDVVALHRPSSRLMHLRKFPVCLAEGSVEDRASLDRAMPADVDVVFHVAGDLSQWSGHRNRQWRTNVEGTRNMVEEEVLKGVDQGLDAVILNPTNVIGRYDWGTWSRFIRLAANGRLFRIPPGSACYCDVGAVVRAHVTAAERGRTGHNYLLGGDVASYADVVRIVGDIVGRPCTARVGRPIALRVAGRVSEWASMVAGKEPMISPESAAMLNAHIVCRSDKAERELDYRPVSVEAMLKECIDWMIEQKLLRPAA